MDYQLILNTTIGCWNCSKTFVREILSRHKGRPVNVLISSPGGLLDDGLDIMHQFRDHGDVTVYISGFTASAATVAAMGAKKIVLMLSYPSDEVGNCLVSLDKIEST